MRDGAADYILKDRLTRLGAAVRTAIGRDRDRLDKSAAERAQREAEQRLGLLVRATNDAVWDLDLVNWKLEVDEEFLALIGYAGQRGPLTLDAWHERIHMEDRDRVRTGLETVLGSRTNFWSDEYRLRRSDGTYAQVLDRGLVMRNAEGKAIRVVGALMDVSERQLLQEQLLQSQKLEAVGRLAGGIAHDFNNVLTSIMAAAYALEGSTRLTDEERLEVREIRVGGERAAELTSQLLAFSRKRVITVRNLDLNETVRSVATMLERVIGEDVKLVVSPGQRLGAVRADQGQLEQILLNLAVNARDAMPGGGTLTIETAAVDLDRGIGPAELPPGAYARLRVADTGVGIDAATIERIFEPFFTTKDIGRGTGLGLSTLYGIVHQHGGHVGVTSEPGQGTTFTIHLPRVDEAPDVRPPTPRTEATGGSESILLVEDDELVRATTRRSLDRLGYTVTPVASANDARTALRVEDASVDLLVTDIVLAGDSGLELVRELRKTGFRAPVLFLSGYAEEMVLREGELPERSSFLAKPFTPILLAQRVREALSTSATDSTSVSAQPR
jgi:PAS domain S-box-containing protein